MEEYKINLKIAQDQVMMLGYSLWDKYGYCNCEYCVIGRANHNLNKLHYMLKRSIEMEKYEIANHIKNEINFHDKYFDKKSQDIIRKKKKEIYIKYRNNGKIPIIKNPIEWLLKIINTK